MNVDVAALPVHHHIDTFALVDGLYPNEVIHPSCDVKSLHMSERNVFEVLVVRIEDV